MLKAPFTLLLFAVKQQLRYDSLVACMWFSILLT